MPDILTLTKITNINLIVMLSKLCKVEVISSYFFFYFSFLTPK